MDDIVDEGGFCEPLSTLSTPNSDVLFISRSSTLYSFSNRGSKYYDWMTQKCSCGVLGRLYKRLFPLGYKKEFKSLLKIAWPISASTFFNQLLYLVTAMFVGHLGQIELDATALGLTMVNVTGVSVMWGLSSACDTLFPQIYGSSNRRNMGVVVQKSMIILLLLCIPCWAVFINIEHILLATGQDPVISNLAGKFVLCYIPILPANVLFLVLSKYLQAQSVVLPSCVILVLGNLLNGLLAALFLYWLNMGMLGAGLALGLSCWSIAGLHILYIQVTKIYTDTWSGWSFQALSEWRQFISLSVPGLFMMCLEWWCFEVFLILAGLLGVTELAAHAVLFQLANVLFMLCVGIAVAASVRIGNHLGAGNPPEAMTAANVSISLIWIIAIAIWIVLLLLKSFIGKAFTNDESVIDLVSMLIPVTTLCFLFDATQAVCSGILRGTGKQMFGAVFNFFSYYFFALPLGSLLMFKTDLRLKGLWLGILCSLIFQSIAFLVKIGITDWIKESKLAQVRAGRREVDDTGSRDKDISPLHSPMSPSDLDLMEADHIQLSTYSSLESVRSSQSDELSELQKTLLKRGVFVVCLLMVLSMGIVLDQVLSHLNTHSNCFIIQGKDINLTLIANDLKNNETIQNATLGELQFLNFTYWFEKVHHENATFTYCNGYVSEKPVSSASYFNMTSFLFNFHHKIPHRPLF